MLNNLDHSLNKNNNKIFKDKFHWKKFILWLPFMLLGLFMIIIPLIMIIIITFIPVEGGNVNDNWNILTTTIWVKIGKSLGIALISTIICLLISYPFCYFLVQVKSKNVRKILFLLISMPMWLGSLIIIISLKILFDKTNGIINSTYGDIYVIIAIVYLYIPYMIIPLYNTLEQLPKNLIDASKDLGRGTIYTFFKVVIPYTKIALISAITLVLLPSISVVAIPQFLNNDPNGSLIGDIIMDQGQQALQSKIALARVCVLSLIVSLIMFIIYSLIVMIPKILTKISQYKSIREIKNA